MNLKTCSCNFQITTKNAVRVLRQIDNFQNALYFNCPQCHSTRAIFKKRPKPATSTNGIDRNALREKITFFLCTTRGVNLVPALEKLLDEIELEHRKAMRPLCVSLAEIGVAIIDCAQDTLWVGPVETAIDRVFNELALEMDSREGEPKQQLQHFIEGREFLWPEKLKEKKSKEPAPSELSPKNSK